MQGTLVAGSWGVGINGAFLVIVLWRTTVLFRSSRRVFPLTTKKCFHILLGAFVALEIPYYALLMADRDYSRAGYLCHLLALWCDLAAFSCVIILWARTLSMVRNTRGVVRSVIAVDVFNALCTLACTSTLFLSDSLDDFQSRDSWAYLALYTVYAVTLFLYSLWLVYYGLLLQARVTSHPNWEVRDRLRRIRILLRINGVFIVCAVCFFLRIIMVTVLLAAELRASTAQGWENISDVQWLVLSSWVPTLVPSGALLYMMRKPDALPATARHEDAHEAPGEGSTLRQGLLATSSYEPPATMVATDELGMRGVRKVAAHIFDGELGLTVTTAGDFGALPALWNDQPAGEDEHQGGPAAEKGDPRTESDKSTP